MELVLPAGCEPSYLVSSNLFVAYNCMQREGGIASGTGAVNRATQRRESHPALRPVRLGRAA
jgi:hypothetical protein